MVFLNKDAELKFNLENRLTDPFGNILLLKRALTGLLGIATYPHLNIINKTKVEGAEYLMDLPKTNVLFVSNHQTYYADVMALYHVFGSVKWRFKNLDIPLYLLGPRVKTYYIAAEETIKDGSWLSKMFAYVGAVTVKRSWRHKGKDVNRGADLRAPAKIRKALNSGWVINFPQGTTTPNAPIRKGSASLIKSFRPIVVPVELCGFDEAFDRKGLKVKKKGVELSVIIKKPVQFGEDQSVEDIHEFLKANILNNQ